MAIKAAAPRTPTWAILVGVGLLDLLFGPFVLAGLERVSLTPGSPPGFSLDHIDWSHSLTMSLVWSTAFGLVFLGRGRAVAFTVAAAVFSHFALDLVMHPPDLALWPGSPSHLGLGLWRAMPTGWWFVELGFIAGAFGYYLTRARALRTFGGRAWAVGLVIVLLHAFNSPWLSLT
jgi:hypothetical protein